LYADKALRNPPATVIVSGTKFT